MEITSKFITPGILLLLTLIFGFWVSSAGRPYNGILFNVHKLIALGAVVLAVIQFSKTLKTPDILVIILLILVALCVIALFASGALLSMGRLDQALMLTIHRVAPIVMILTLILTLYLLDGRKA